MPICNPVGCSLADLHKFITIAIMYQKIILLCQHYMPNVFIAYYYNSTQNYAGIINLDIPNTHEALGIYVAIKCVQLYILVFAI